MINILRNLTDGLHIYITPEWIEYSESEYKQQYGEDQAKIRNTLFIDRVLDVAEIYNIRNDLKIVDFPKKFNDKYLYILNKKKDYEKELRSTNDRTDSKKWSEKIDKCEVIVSKLDFYKDQILDLLKLMKEYSNHKPVEQLHDLLNLDITNQISQWSRNIDVIKEHTKKLEYLSLLDPDKKNNNSNITSDVEEHVKCMKQNLDKIQKDVDEWYIKQIDDEMIMRLRSKIIECDKYLEDEWQELNF